MLELLALMLKECLFFMGYITGQSQFPKPLSRAEEQEMTEKAAQGDKQARDRLIEHNLRLDAHIMKKC